MGFCEIFFWRLALLVFPWKPWNTFVFLGMFASSFVPVAIQRDVQSRMNVAWAKHEFTAEFVWNQVSTCCAEKSKNLRKKWIK